MKSHEIIKLDRDLIIIYKDLLKIILELKEIKNIYFLLFYIFL